MLEQLIRPHYQRIFLDPITKNISSRIHPIHVTWLAGIFGLLIIPALMLHYVNLAILLLIISGFLDTLDGTLARYCNCATPFGAMLDIVMDRTVEFAVIVGLWTVSPTTRSLMCLFMLGSMLFCVTSFLTVAIYTTNDSNKGFYYSPGIIERAEAFLFFIMMMLFPNYFTTFASIFCLTVIITTVMRIFEFVKLHYQNIS